MEQFDLGWLVGIFEGEGCFWTAEVGSICASVTNTDKIMLRRFQKLIGCGTIYTQTPNRNVARKPVYVWRVARIDEVHFVANLLYPHLSIRRRTQARKVLARQYKRNPRVCAKGHVKSDDNLYVTKSGKRLCLKCKRAAGRAVAHRRKDAHAAYMREWRARP